MPTVKGTRQDDLIIEPRAQGSRVLRFFFFVFLLVAIAAGGYFSGYANSRLQIKNLRSERDALVSDLGALRASVASLREQLAIFEKGDEIDRRTSENLRETVSVLGLTVTQLEEEVAFYKSIMSPEDGEEGLKIHSVDIVPTDNPSQFHYSVVLAQVKTNSKTVRGRVLMAVSGSQAGENVTLPLASLSDEVDSEGPEYRFRYYQEISGNLLLPQDFIPEQIQIVLRPSGSQSNTVEAIRSWNSSGEV